MKEYTNLLLSLDSGVLTLLINRPAKLNALNKQTVADLGTCLIEAIADASVRSILISGAGDKAFVAGADIAEFAGLTPAQGEELARLGHQSVFNVIENSPKPILAAINGFALGGGLELALACHLRIASTKAKLGLPELSLGLIPGYGGTQRLSKLIGKSKAMEFILLGTQITPEQALSTGLVNEVVAPDELIPYSRNLLEKISKKSPLSIAAAIRAINASDNELKDQDQANSQPLPLGHGYEIEIKEFSTLFGSSDFTEGVAAFLEKREARFTGK